MVDDNRPDDVPDDESGKPSGPPNPFQAMFEAMGLTGPGGQQPDFEQLMRTMQQAFSSMGMAQPQGPGIGFRPPGGTPNASGVNWTQIKDIARKTVASLGPDPTPMDNQRAALREAAEIAEGWLDGATSLPKVTAPAQAWSRAEWVENTLPTWRRLAEPIAESMGNALADALTGRGTDPTGGAGDPMAQMGDMLRPLLRSSGGAMFGMQMGQGLGKLATEVVGTTDIGLPLGSRPQVTLLPANVAAFGEGLEQSDTDVRIYLTLREAARQRLFAATPWLREQIYSLVLQYARGITIDTDALEQSLEEMQGENGLDLNALGQFSEKVEASLLKPAATPEQRETLLSVETLLALVEGWVDEVVGQATATWMPSATALTETMRRTRATGGPAEQTFATLIGLELRPARLRDAANLWAALREARGAEGRDDVWAHPDLMPDAAALDDPLGYVGGESAGSDLDAELAKLLGGDSPGGSAEQDGPDEDGPDEDGPRTPGE